MSIDPAGMRDFLDPLGMREFEMRAELERLRADNVRLAEIESESWRQMKAELEQLRSERANRIGGKMSHPTDKAEWHNARRKEAWTEFEEFILALDAAIKDGARAEQALRAYVINRAAAIRLSSAPTGDARKMEDHKQ